MKSHARRGGTELRGVFVVRRLVALFDAGARCYPLVGGLNDLFQVGIRQNTFRVGVSHSEDAGVMLIHWLDSTLSPGEIKRLFRTFYIDDLAALVSAGLRVDAMRNFGLARILVDIVLRNAQGIVSTALARASFGMSSFWIWHYFL